MKRKQQRRFVGFESVESRRLLSIVYVDANAPGGAQNGASWATAYLDVQQALTAAIAGTEIRVANGTYKPTASDRNSTFQLKNSVALIGGYAGYGAVNPDARDVAAYASVLSGDIGTPGVKTDNSYHVVTGSGTNNSAVLDGFTITQGYAEGGGANKIGAGMYNSAGSPTVSNCSFVRNMAVFTAGSGGAMANSSHSSPIVTNCLFAGNGAAGAGAVSNSVSSSPVFTQCVFSGNFSSDSGGGVSNSGECNPLFVQCTFAYNAAPSGAGAFISVTGAAPTLKNCILWGNTTQTTSQLQHFGGVLTVQYCDVQDGATGTGNVNVEPLFVRNPSPGADAAWGTNDDDYGDLRLQASSPLVDSGQNSDVPAGITSDFGGASRFQDVPTAADTGSGAAPVVDIGAYEAVPALSASAGGPYMTGQSQGLAVAGRGASDVAGTLQYAWEWTGNGQFDDAATASAFLPAGVLPAGTSTIYLRVTDSASQSVITSSSVTVIATTIYVDSRAQGANDGSSWANAFTRLADALALTQPVSEIRVATGTYYPSTIGYQGASFGLKSDLAVLGGFAGLGAGNPNLRNPALYPTTLSGDLKRDGMGIDNSYHVVTATNANQNTLLDGFTVTGGNAQYPAQNGGGAIYVSGGNPTISNCIFTANLGSEGGAISTRNASPTFTNCTISNNNAVPSYSEGGGMFCLYGAPVITNCKFTGNTADYGGGLYLGQSDAIITNCTFTSNIGIYEGGGGMYSYGSIPTITKCTFLRNVARNGNSDQAGGGMYNNSSSPIITDCVFLGNSGSVGAGMFNVYSSWPKITNCIFVGNIASNYGGGGIWTANGAAMNVVNCTFANNKARDNGGGIYCTGYSTVTNSVFFNNTAAKNGQISSSDSLFSVTYTNVSDKTGTGNVNADPKFARNPSPGNDAVWGTGDDDYGDLRLQPNSPSVDSGSNAAIAGFTTDIAGTPRIQDVPGLRDPGPTVDMGAYESWLYVYVDPAATGLKHGRTWNDAFTSIEAALANAVVAQQLRIAQGTYTPINTSGRSSTFLLRPGIGFYGGFSGLAGGNPDARDVTQHPTILSGNVGLPNDSSDNLYHVITSIGGTIPTVLDGLTLAGGNANGALASDQSGGGVYNAGGNLSISNCIIRGNLALGRGGGIFNTAGSLNIVNTVLSGNAVTGAGGTGGGIHTELGAVSIASSTFAGNSAVAAGGAIEGAATVIHSIVWGNTAPVGAQFSVPVVATFSDIQGGWAGNGNFNSDPLFTNASGGDGIAGTADDDLTLQALSPCVDRGNNLSVQAGMWSDMVGNLRFSDVVGVRDPGAIIDIGAFERVGVWGVTNSEYLYSAIKPSIKVSFGSELSIPSLQAGDLQLVNLTTGESVNCGTLAMVSYDSATRSATWVFTNFVLPDGNYRATLPIGSINDSFGAPLAINHPFDFFALGGDANHDRVVDAEDLAILSLNWQKTSRIFSQADFNYDRRVDIRDMYILASSWQKTLAPPPPPAVPVVANVAPPKRTATRVASLVL